MQNLKKTKQKDLDKVDISIFSTVNETWQNLLSDLEKAEDSIVCEEYTVDDKEIGTKFLKILLKKAKAGLEVKLLIDRFGSNLLCHSDLIDELKESGVEISIYNDINGLEIIKFWRWLPRTHVKFFQIDTKIIYTGGVCLDQKMKKWDDLMIRLYLPNNNQKYPFLKNVTSLLKNSEQDDVITLTFSNPYIDKFPANEMLYKKLSQAKNKITINTPYFLPPKKFQYVLFDAVKRGVKVTVTAPEHTDSLMQNCVSLIYYKDMLQNGIEVHLNKGNMNHTKLFMVDKNWAMMGSSNFDYLSLKRNREANLFIDNHIIIDDLKEIYQSFQNNSKPIDLNYINIIF